MYLRPAEPFFALIDDDGHSAYVLARSVKASGGPEVRFLGNSENGLGTLVDMLTDRAAHWPDMVIVDLKAHSRATLDFISQIHGWLRQKGVLLAAIVPPTDRSGCSALIEAGAGAVFFRQPERDAFRREMEAILEFWAREPRLDAVGL